MAGDGGLGRRKGLHGEAGRHSRNGFSWRQENDTDGDNYSVCTRHGGRRQNEAGRCGHAVPRRPVSPIGRLLPRGAGEQSALMAADARHAPRRRTADTALSHCLSSSLSRSFSLSLSLGWRRLLLSSAWESGARFAPATAYSCYSLLQL